MDDESRGPVGVLDRVPGDPVEARAALGAVDAVTQQVQETVWANFGRFDAASARAIVRDAEALFWDAYAACERDDRRRLRRLLGHARALLADTERWLEPRPLRA